MNVFEITLEALNPPEKHFRSYRVSAGRDLFGKWSVQIAFGRIGATGRILSHSAESSDEAITVIKSALARRRSSPRRIGVPYRITNLYDPENWLES